MVWLKVLPGYVYQSDIPGTPTITSWGAEFDQATSDAILAEAAGWNRRNRQGQVLVVVGDPPIYTPGGSTGGGGGSSGGGVSQEAFDAAIATLQGKATAATDAELAAAVATINIALGTKQDAASAVTSSEFAAAVATLQDKATAATDSELASAVATLNSALAGKQDLATAATDSEVAAAVASLNSAIAAKQDAATAATDAELAAAVATINAAIAANSSAIALKQDAATASTDAERDAAIAAHAADLTLHSPSGQRTGLAVNETGVTLALTAALQAIPTTSVPLPQIARPQLLVGRAVVKCTAAMTAATVSSVGLYIADDLGNYLEVGWVEFNSATTSSWQTVMVYADIEANAAARTYHLEASRNGSTTGTLQILNGNISPAYRAALRAVAA